MHTEAKTLSVKENQRSFISYLLKDGRDGNITDIPVNEFWTRVAMHPLKGTKKVKVMGQGNCGRGLPLLLEEMRASEAEHAHMAGDTKEAIPISGKITEESGRVLMARCG